MTAYEAIREIGRVLDAVSPEDVPTVVAFVRARLDDRPTDAALPAFPVGDGPPLGVSLDDLRW